MYIVYYFIFSYKFINCTNPKLNIKTTQCKDYKDLSHYEINNNFQRSNTLTEILGKQKIIKRKNIKEGAKIITQTLILPCFTNDIQSVYNDQKTKQLDEMIKFMKDLTN